MANNPHKRTDQLLQGMADRFRRMGYVDAGYLQEHDLTADETRSILPAAADILEGVLALPFKYQLIIRLMGGEDGVSAEQGLRMWLELYRSDVLGQVAPALEKFNAQSKSGK